jgi:hypothetical protein
MKIEKYKVMPGYLFVVPDKEDGTVAGMAIGRSVRELPVGTVIEAGIAPAIMYKWWQLPLRAFGLLPFGVRPGSRVLYSRVSASDIDLVVDGKDVKCKCIKWPDVRANLT